MALTPINPTEKQEKKSALETFARVLGIASSLGSLGLQGYETFNSKPADLKLSDGTDPYFTGIFGRK